MVWLSGPGCCNVENNNATGRRKSMAHGHRSRGSKEA
jgi:hypothetical protein